jgi:alpha-L-fucosidase
LIFTCKHHDGFCLWPSKYTSHTIAASPYKNGKGDIVREVSDACRAAGIRFGVYISPWDRNNAAYGKGKAYDDYFVNQLTELLTQYGDVFDVWFDGACVENARGEKQYYDWERYYATIRALQPGACINVCGPDIRWCGNEAGHTRNSEWSVVPRRTMDTEKIASASQHTDDAEFRQRKISAHDLDLGSREALRGEPELIWYPAEVNTSIRPGWFYHTTEDDQVRSLEDLKHVYCNSIGGNATFLLNIPPTREGLFHENDVRRLKEIGNWLQSAFRDNLLRSSGTTLTATAHKTGHEVQNVLEDTCDTYFTTEDGVTAVTLEATWEGLQAVKYAVLKENILQSQRVERFAIELHTEQGWMPVYAGTVIGYKRIVPLEGIPATGLRVRIVDARVAPTIAFLGVYA